jgi:sensor histidine kinase regulating citrate/malate metabolism
MKAIKIGLAIVVIGAIIFFVIKWLATTNEVDEIPASENTSTKLIDDKVILEIEDNGPGIPDNIKDKNIIIITKIITFIIKK